MAKRDHPNQAVDTEKPGDQVNEAAWEAMRDEYEGDPDDVDAQADDEDQQEEAPSPESYLEESE